MKGMLAWFSTSQLDVSVYYTHHILNKIIKSHFSLSFEPLLNTYFQFNKITIKQLALERHVSYGALKLFQNYGILYLDTGNIGMMYFMIQKL